MAKRILVPILFFVSEAVVGLSVGVAQAEPSTIADVAQIRRQGELRALYDLEFRKTSASDSEISVSPGKPYGRRIKDLEMIAQRERARANQAASPEDQNDYLASAHEAKEAAEGFRYNNQNCEMSFPSSNDSIKIPAGSTFSVRPAASQVEGRTAFTISSNGRAVGSASCLSSTSAALAQSSFLKMGLHFKLPAYPKNLFVTIADLFAGAPKREPMKPDHDLLVNSILRTRKSLGFADAQLQPGMYVEQVQGSPNKKKVTVTLLHAASGKQVRESYLMECGYSLGQCSYNEVKYLRRPIPTLPAEPTETVASAANSTVQ